MRRLIAALTAAMAVVAGGGAVYVATRHPSSPHRPNPSTATPSPSPGTAQALAITSVNAPLPTRVGVTRALRHAAANAELGGDLAALVVDATTGEVMFSRRADVRLPPASNAKLLTAFAALRTLGPDATLSTAVLREGSTLYLRGGGDVTIQRHPSSAYPATADLATLARRVAGALGGTGRFHLAYDATAWSGPTSAPGWSPGYFTEGDVSRLSALEVDEGLQSHQPNVPRVQDPSAQAVAAFRDALRAAGVRLIGASRAAATPPTATELAHVVSPPVAALVQRMLTASDNDLAEALAREVAAKTGQPTTFAGAAAAVMSAVRAGALPTTGMALHDGSGLSRLDRVTPRLLVSIVRAATSDQRLRPLLLGLPVAGLTGTLGDRYRSKAMRFTAAGVVRAKTGTLAGVSALSGEVLDADGRLLLFALLTGKAGSPSATERALDTLAATLARCGCR